MEEAHWLVFLATHFGKHLQDGWRLTADVYGRLNDGGRWDWKTITGDPIAFRVWLAANQAQLLGRKFSNHRKFESLKAASAKGTAVVACMDARLNVFGILGLNEGDAHVIRNAGGLVTDDVLRSLVISHWLLGTEQAVVIGHVGCGMLTFTNEELQERLERETGADAGWIDFHPFSDLEQSVRASVERIRESLLLPDQFAASGFVYDVHSGELREVVPASVSTR